MSLPTPPGTLVTLAATLLAPVSDLTSVLSLYVTSKPYTPTVSGSVNAYAGGRFRAVSMAGVGRGLDVTATLVDLATRGVLESWIGSLLLYRDPHGQKVYGTYFGLKVTEVSAPNLADVEFTLTEVTYDESV